MMKQECALSSYFGWTFWWTYTDAYRHELTDLAVFFIFLEAVAKLAAYKPLTTQLTTLYTIIPLLLTLSTVHSNIIVKSIII